MNWLSDIDIGSVGAGTIVVIVVILLLRGWLLPRRVHVDRMADKDAEITRLSNDVRDWREAWRAESKARGELQEQNGELLELARTGAHAINSIAQAASDG